MHYWLLFAKLTLEKGKCGWLVRRIDTSKSSNKDAIGELEDVSNFNIITWYQWAIKQYGDWYRLYQRNAVQAFSEGK